MILLRLISWPYVRRHLTRSLLTAAGIVLGVGVFVGMHTANRSVLAAFHRTADRIAGATQLQVTAGQMGFGEEVLEKIQALPEVRVAVPVIEAVADTGIRGQGDLMILAVDMTGDRSLRDYALEAGNEEVVDDPLVFLAQPDSLIVTREFATRNHLSTNSRVPMRTMDGEKQFTIRGIMGSGGLASAFGGNLAVMDVYAAQKVFGRGRRFDRIDIAVNEGVSVEQGRLAIEKLLGPGFEVQPPSTRSQQFDSVVSVYSEVVNITSLFALFIGMFIIYNSFAIAVTQRRPEIGILRALGATRGQIRSLFLVESLVAGLIGSVVGLGFGLLMARAMTGYVGGLIQNVYGIAQSVDEVATEPWLMAFAIGMGIVTSIAAAFIPARNAARVDPVQALQKGKYQVLSAGENRVRRITALVFGVASVIALFLGNSRPVFYAGYVLAMLAALLFTPTLALVAMKALRPALKWLRPVEGSLAADSLLQAPRRTSGTVAALMLSISLVVALGGVSRASYTSILDWANTALNPDLFVTGSANITSRQFRFPPSVGEELRRLDQVAAVETVRSDRIMFRGRPVFIVSLEIEDWARRARRHPTEGNEEEMYRLASQGRGVIFSDNLASLAHLHVGNVVDLPAPNGVLRLPIVGIVGDWSDQQGTIFVERGTFIRYWGDDSVNVFRVYLKPGVSPEAGKAQILEQLSGPRRLFVLTNRQVREYILRVTEQWLGLTYSQIAVAVLVAVLGIVNALTVSIIDRRRELGVLRAVGGLRNQVRHTIWMEALAIAVVGLALGIALGAVNLHYVLEVSHREISGMALPYRFPFTIATTLVPIMLAAAFVAALWPAEAAIRGSLVEALEYE